MAEQGIGLGLSRRFYKKLVAPVIAQRFPELKYAAARIGLGSEVLGYDTAISADHDYGPCVQIFLPTEHFAETARVLLAEFDAVLPQRFEGYPVRYPTAVRPPADGAGQGLLGSDHGVEFYTLAAWSDRFLGRQFAGELSNLDWLGFGEQIFVTVTAGEVFHDAVGELSGLRARLKWFPRDVWLCKLAAQWGRIAEERAYIGRTGGVGDELGSRVIGARMVGNLMRLALLLERRYAPYPKWFGSAFARLDCAGMLTPMLDAALAAGAWQAREAALLEACRFLAERQVELGVPGAIPPVEGSLHDRPLRFIDTVAISEAIRGAIVDPALKDVPGFGGADQFLGNFVLAVPDWSRSAAEALLRD